MSRWKEIRSLIAEDFGNCGHDSNTRDELVVVIVAGTEFGEVAWEIDVEFGPIEMM